MRFGVQCAILAFIFCNLVFISEEDNGIEPNSGPYKTTVKKITAKCVETSYPYQKDPLVIPKFELYNTSTKVNMMRANFTILKTLVNIMVKVKGFNLENGEPRLTYYLNNISCKSLMLKAFISISGAPFGINTCRYPKSVIIMKTIDVNQMDHVWVMKREYGKMLWRVEVFTQKGTILCFELDILSEPA